ncbi:hypothetical protein pb186bvf_000804 [Paramecium bursaria]
MGDIIQYVSNPEAQVQQQFIDEHMFKLNKDQIMNNSSKILVKLIYLENQGIQFNEEEVEQLVCRITKLFQSNNSRLREMTYNSLKKIMPQKFVHILIQCLNKDLKSSNPYIKQQVLKFIPFIQGEQSSTAPIVGIHIINKFSNLVGKWFFDVVQRLEEPKENLDYHVLILFHEIKKQNLTSLINILMLLIKKEQSPLLQLQIITFIQEILPYTSNPQKKEFINYLFQQVRSLDPLKVFESSKVLIDLDLEKEELFAINKFVEDNMTNYVTCVNQYSSLKFVSNLLEFNLRKQVLTNEQIILIHVAAFRYRTTRSALGIILLIKLDSQNAAHGLKDLFYKANDTTTKINFLKGLREKVTINTEYNMIILEFLKIMNLKVTSNNEVVIAKNLNNQFYSSQSRLKLQRCLVNGYSVNRKQILIIRILCNKIIKSDIFNISTIKMDVLKIKIWFKYLKDRDLIQLNPSQLTFVKEQYEILQNHQVQIISTKKEQKDNLEDKGNRQTSSELKGLNNENKLNELN